MSTGTTGNAHRASRWRGPQLTVPGWHNLLLSIMGVVVLAGAVAGAVLINRTEQLSRELTDEIQPSRVAAEQLQAALRDQETATRGYVITADRQFLDPYYDGLSAERAAAEDIRGLAGNRADLIADLEAIERASAAWRTTYAEPLIASVTPGAPHVANIDAAEHGKAEFDGIRELFDTQNAHLVAARTVGIDELVRVRSWRDRVLIAMVATFFATALLLAFLVRRAVTRPLAALAAACRRITEGNFGDNISLRGPRRPLNNRRASPT